MCKFISRIRVRKSANDLPKSALLNHQRIEQWRQRYLAATGKEPTTNELLDQLDRAVEEYNKTTEVRIVL